MKSETLTYDQVHEFAEEFPGAHWNGWTLVLFRPDRRGFKSGQFRADGMRHVGRWGTAIRVPMTEQGTWEVPSHVMAKRTRN